MNQQRKTIYALRRQVLEGRYAPEPTEEEKKAGKTEPTRRCRPSRASTPSQSLADDRAPDAGAHVSTRSTAAAPVADRRRAGAATATAPVAARSGAAPLGSSTASSAPTPTSTGIVEDRTGTLDRLADEVALVDDPAARAHARPVARRCCRARHRRALSAQRARRGLGPRRAARGDQGALRLRARRIDEQGALERETLAEALWSEVEKVIEAREAEFPLPFFLYFARHFFLEEIDAALDRAPQVDGGAARGHRPARLRPEGSQAGVQEGRLRHLRRDDDQHQPQRLREAVPHAGPARGCAGGAAHRGRPAVAKPPTSMPPRRRAERARRSSRAAASRPQRQRRQRRRRRARPSRSAATSPRSAATIRAPAAAARNTRSATAPSPRRNRSRAPLRWPLALAGCRRGRRRRRLPDHAGGDAGGHAAHAACQTPASIRSAPATSCSAATRRRVRWAALDASGTLSGEQAFALPTGVTQAYYAVGGRRRRRATRVLIGLPRDRRGQRRRRAGPRRRPRRRISAAAAPPVAVVDLSGRRSRLQVVGGDDLVAQGDERRARLDRRRSRAWSTWPPSTPAGMLTGAAGRHLDAGDPQLLLPRVRARQGRSDRRLLQRPGRPRPTSTAPGWVIAETSEAGSVDATTLLGLRSPRRPAPGLTPTAAGYSLVWQDSRGRLAGRLHGGRDDARRAPYPFASATSFGGANLQPPARRPGAVRHRLRRAAGAPARRRALAARRRSGSRRPGAVIFPSINGDLGTVSALPVNGAGRDLRRLHQPDRRLAADRRQGVPQRGMLLAWNNRAADAAVLEQDRRMSREADETATSGS